MFYVEASVGVMDLRLLPSIAHKRGSKTRGCASARAGASVDQRGQAASRRYSLCLKPRKGILSMGVSLSFMYL